MDKCSWIRLLPWRQKNKAVSNSIQIMFAPNLKSTRHNDWVYLELLLRNPYSCTVWREEVFSILADLDPQWQTVVATGQAVHKIRQSVGPNVELSVSLAAEIYDAAGRSEGRYTCIDFTNARYRVHDVRCDAGL